MKKFWNVLPMVMMLCVGAAFAHAQGGTVQDGCVNSPENPTAILAVVGSLGGAAAVIRARWAGRRKR